MEVKRRRGDNHPSVSIEGIGLRTPRIPKSTNAQMSFIKWVGICIQPAHILLYTLNHPWITYNT
jgi:hypothetical protein